MRLSSVLSEAWRNLVSGTARAATLAVVLVLSAGSLAVLDVRAVVEVIRAAEEFRTAQASTWVFGDEDRVDGARCQALSSVDGVGAGASRRGPGLRALALPSSELTVWEVTPGLVDVVAGDPGGPEGGLWLSSDLAETLGVGRGSALATSAGAAVVAGVYRWPDDGRVRTLGYSVLAPVAADGAFDACWAQVWPPDEDVAALLYSTSLADQDTDARITQANSRLGATYDAATHLEARLTRWAPAAAAAAGVLAGWAGVRLRRLQVAGALHARVPRAHLGWLHLVEAACWVVAASVVSAALTLWATRAGNPSPDLGTWAIGLRTVGAGAGAALLGTLVAVLGTRERHLFRYFKDR